MFFLKRVSKSGHAVIGEQGLRRSGCSAKRVLTGWGKPMGNVTEYRPSAASLLDLAQRTNSPADKNRLLVMAEAQRTRGVYDALIARGYTEYRAITSRQCRRLLRLAGGGAVRQDHRHLRHRPRSAAAAAAAEGGRDHGDPRRPARRPAAAQDHQGAGGRRHHKGCPVGHLRR